MRKGIKKLLIWYYDSHGLTPVGPCAAVSTIASLNYSHPMHRGLIQAETIIVEKKVIIFSSLY